MPLTPLPGVSGVLLGGGADVSPQLIFGWNITETTGVATAKVRFWDNNTNSGTIIASITLAANESRSDNFSPRGLNINHAVVYYEIVSGSVEGSISWA